MDVDRVVDPAGAATVALRCRPPRPLAAVELCGELPHWEEPLPLRPAGGGRFEATLRLGPGVYAYKLRADDGAWLLDADNPRTVADGDARNSVLVVGGTAEPVLHAPAPPWLWARDDGRVVIRAALRRAAGAGLRLRSSEGERAMRVVGGDGEHVLLEAELPGVACTLEYGFVLGDGRLVAGPGGALLRASPRALGDGAPAWWRDAVVYTVLVDRFRRGGGDGAWPAAASWQREARCGGDLDGVREALPHLVDLGVTALHLTPVTPAPSAHRYDATDLRAVDPRSAATPRSSA
ncbi:MAG: hypothetical protein H6709_08180 [Kofleriaceae bacterium]|nr:hypothetical protein [Kofleriaceae bacterium]